MQRSIVFLIAAMLGTAGYASAGDWPMWRYDAGRGNATPSGLSSTLHLQWERQLPKAQTAWPESQPRLQFDAAPQPVVLGRHLFVPCTVTQSVTAYDTRNGEERWRFFADSPVRFAPIAWKERVYFVSDDGRLYCLQADDGKLLWKINGGPAERWVIGNDRLVSSWPARGGPVLHDGKIYFAASIWPFMGIFVHAVDPDSGEIVWTNSGDGTNFTTHPHGAKAFATVAPHGHLAATGDGIIVPGGRSSPAVYDANTGQLKIFFFDGRSGGHYVAAGNDLFYNGGGTYEVAVGKRVAGGTPAIIEGDKLVYIGSGDAVRVEGIGEVKEVTELDRRGAKVKVRKYIQKLLYGATLPGMHDEVLMKAGSLLLTGGENEVAAYDFTELKTEKSLNPVWKSTIEGDVWELIAADDRLFVVTMDARVYCFGPEQTDKVKRHAVALEPLAKENDVWRDKVKAILENKGTGEGYCVAFGIGSGRLIDELLAQSKLYVIAVDADAEKVDALRRRMNAAGLYGQRISAHVGAPERFALPKYLANLIVSEDAAALSANPATVAKIFEVLRPYGGIACFELGEEQHKRLVESTKDGKIRRQDDFTLLVREGALPGSADWTHQYADAGQSNVSRDVRVKAPFGVLWFGGPANDEILPRHGHGPAPQVAGGRVVIEGPHLLRTVDVYTGRVLWETPLKDLGRYYNFTGHFPGAGEIGSNYVTLADKIYAVYGDAIIELDAETGKLTREFKSPIEPSEHWGFISVMDDYLITTSGPLAVQLGKTTSVKGPDAERYGSGSRRLVVFNRHTGKMLWNRQAEMNFRHNNICAGNGKIFCIDNMTEKRQQLLERRGLKFDGTPTLYAIDADSGKVIWSTRENVFGTFLSYSSESDILVQAGSRNSDRAPDEVNRGMVAYQGNDGQVLWRHADLSYGGPCMLFRDKLITNGSKGFAMDLKTGKTTGWEFRRMYGCNTAIGSEHLLTFRSGAAGFCDLDTDSGTGNIGGFRSGCTNNLIVANGVLNAPDYTRTCTCTYQNQTSLALVHMPEEEFWTFGGGDKSGQLGFNLGAPGNRRAPNGTLWRAESKIDMNPEKPEVFRFHSSLVKGDALNWVAASGYRGVEQLTIETKEDGPYTLRLYFLEPDDIAAGKRVFDVRVQDRPMLTGFDVVKEAGEPRKGLVREFDVQSADEQIVIELKAVSGMPPVLSGVELIRKNVP